MPRALIVYGGWEGHTPKETSELFADILRENDFEVVLHEGMDIFDAYENIEAFDLVIPNMTMSEITQLQCQNISKLISEGAGLAGCHGGMCDAFRNCTEWQFMTGAQWVAHPGNDGVVYKVSVFHDSELLGGIPPFKIKSEQYYLHVDPAVTVHAVTKFPVVYGEHATNGIVKMPVVFTKSWGRGRVFYCSLGHTYEIFHNPHAREIMRRGFIWAAI